jgi:ABC-type transport system substrate-binding protein
MKKTTLSLILILLGTAGLIYLGASLRRVTRGPLPAAVTVTLPASPAVPTFSTPEPATVLDDLRVRQAIAYCTDRSELIRAVYPFLEDTKPFVMDSFLSSSHPFYAGSDPHFQHYPYDPGKGRDLLESAGWMLSEGASYRVNANGEELQLTITATDAIFRKTWVPVFIEQMQDCGLHLEASHLKAEQFFSADGTLAQREFEITAFARIVETHPDLQIFSCGGIPSPVNEFTGENFSGWCNQVVEQALARAEGRVEKEALQSAVRTIQFEYARDLPGLPLFQRVDVSATVADVRNFEPLPSQVYTWNAAEWEIPGRDVIVIGERSEPAGLHPLDNSWINQTVRVLIEGMDFIQRDFDYQPVTLKRFPTLENGGATINASGQLVVTYEFIDGLIWSDGTPVSRQDYQLAYEVLCNPEAAGEYNSIPQTCGQITSVDFVNNTTYTVTYVPGYRDPEYFLPPISRQPAHRLTEDGRRLADVPPAYWTWLAEVNNNPIGIGPYVLKSWEYGEEMVFTFNPYYYGGPPATPTISIRFIPQQEIEDHLLRGIIDIADSSSLWIGSVSEVLLQAQVEGRVRLYYVPNITYEQLEFRLAGR